MFGWGESLNDIVSQVSNSVGPLVKEVLDEVNEEDDYSDDGQDPNRAPGNGLYGGARAKGPSAFDQLSAMPVLKPRSNSLAQEAVNGLSQIKPSARDVAFPSNTDSNLSQSNLSVPESVSVQDASSSTESELEIFRQANLELQQKLNACMAELDDLHLNNSSQKTNVVALERENGSLRKKVESLVSELDVHILQRKSASLDDKRVNELEDENARLSETVQTLKDEIRELSQDQPSENQHALLLNEYQVKIEQSSQKYNDLLGKFQCLSDELEASSARVRELESHVEGNNTEELLDNLQTTCNDLEIARTRVAELEQLVAQSASLGTSKIGDTEILSSSRNEASEQYIETMQAQHQTTIKVLKERIDELEKSLEDERQNHTRATPLAEENREGDTAKIELENAISRIAEFEQEIESLENTCKSKAHDLDLAQSDLDTLRTENIALQKENQSVIQDLKEKNQGMANELLEAKEKLSHALAEKEARLADLVEARNRIEHFDRTLQANSKSDCNPVGVESVEMSLATSNEGKRFDTELAPGLDTLSRTRAMVSKASQRMLAAASEEDALQVAEELAGNILDCLNSAEGDLSNGESKVRLQGSLGRRTAEQLGEKNKEFALECDRLKEELDSQKAENEQLQSKVETLSKTIASTSDQEKELEVRERELEHTKQKLTSLEAQVASYEEANLHTQKGLQAEIDHLKSQLAKETTARETLHAQLLEERNQQDLESDQKVLKLKAEIKSHQDLVQNLRGQLKDAESKLDHAVAEKDSLVEKCQTAEELDEKSCELESKVDRLQKDLEQSEKRREELVAECASRTAEVTELSKRLQTMSSSFDSLQESARVTFNSEQKFRDQCSEYEDMIDDLNRSLLEAKSKQSKAEQERHLSMQQVQNLQDDLKRTSQAHKQGVNSLTGQLGEIERLRSKLTEAAEREAHLRSTFKSLSGADQEVNKLKAELQATSAELRVAKLDIERLTSERTNLNIALSEAKNDKDNMIDGYERKLDDIERGRKNVELRLEASIAECHARIQELTDENSALQARVQEMVASAKALPQKSTSESVTELEDLKEPSLEPEVGEGGGDRQDSAAVDREMLRSLVVRYFESKRTGTHKSQHEILILLANFLDFSEDDRIAVGLLLPKSCPGEHNVKEDPVLDTKLLKRIIFGKSPPNRENESKPVDWKAMEDAVTQKPFADLFQDILSSEI